MIAVLTTIIGLSVYIIIRYLILTGIPFYFFTKSTFNFEKNKIQTTLSAKSDIKREILQSIFASIIIAIFAYIFLFSPLSNLTKRYNNINDYPIWWAILSFFLAFLIQDTYFYWTHRILHHKKIYAFIHWVHHKSTNTTPFTSYSFHLFESIVEVGIVPVLLCLIPMHRAVFLLYTLIAFMINIYGHLGYEITPKWFRNSILFKFINTSVYHNLHHSKFIGNYSLFFRWWDRWMNTENPDYESTFDKIQWRRFGSIIILILLPFLGLGQQIEGNWQDHETGIVIQIFKDHNKIQGKLITFGNPTDDEKYKGQTILILKDFIPKNPKNYCCGSIFLPRRKLSASGDLKLLSENQLQVLGRIAFLSKKMVWVRI